jgi:glycosyltransferase involved in cell wall biosynthesis
MNRPLQILHLTTFYPPYSFGGDAMYLYRLVHALGDAGHDVDVVHCLDAYHLLHPAAPSIQFADHPRVTVHGLRSGFGALSPLVTQQTGMLGMKARRIAELLNRKSYDVIHYHNISLLGPQVLALKPERGSPLKIYTTHEHWLICPTHVLWKFNKRTCDKPECFKCSLVSGKPPQFWRYSSMLKSACAHVDRFVSPSRFTAEMHRERGFPYPVTHLPYFIDRADEDWRNPAPRPQARPYFLFVGRLERIKGLDTLIRAWRQVGDIDLLVAGEGTYGPALRQMAEGDCRIKFLGALSQRELGRLYYHAVACLVPSLTVETFGIILIEAFARKTPVIVRDLGALPEVVRDSQGGFVFRTETELIDAIQRFASCPELGMELGENGYKAFLRWWSREAHLDMYMDTLGALALEKLHNVPWQDSRVQPFALPSGKLMPVT